MGGEACGAHRGLEGPDRVVAAPHERERAVGPVSTGIPVDPRDCSQIAAVVQWGAFGPRRCGTRARRRDAGSHGGVRPSSCWRGGTGAWLHVCKFAAIDGTPVIAWLQEVWLYVTNFRAATAPPAAPHQKPQSVERDSMAPRGRYLYIYRTSCSLILPPYNHLGTASKDVQIDDTPMREIKFSPGTCCQLVPETSRSWLSSLFGKLGR